MWDLLAGGGPAAARRRALVEHSVGPVWEANHVWLVYVIVLTWSGFPGVFAAVSSTMYVPLTLVALGIIARGSAFAFRKAGSGRRGRRIYGAAFAVSSVLTPFFLGAIAGGIASGRVPPGVAAGDLVSSWANPTSLVAGALAVGTAAFLAAVYLCADAVRSGSRALAEGFRRRALVTAVLVGVIALTGVVVVRADAPDLFTGLIGQGRWFVLLSAVGGLTAIGLLVLRRYVLARVAAAVAVGGLLWGWAVSQYPTLLPGTTVSDAAAHPAVIEVVLAASAVAAVILLPALWWMFTLFQTTDPPLRRHRGRARSER
jgi:cytochrome bd ubiquinol oxidase subunit II